LNVPFPYPFLGGNGIFFGGAFFNDGFFPRGFRDEPALVAPFGLGFNVGAEPVLPAPFGFSLGFGVGIGVSSSLSGFAAAGAEGGFNFSAGPEPVAGLGLGVGALGPGNTGFGFGLITGGMSIWVASSGGADFVGEVNGFNGGASSFLSAAAPFPAVGGEMIFGVGGLPPDGFKGGG